MDDSFIGERLAKARVAKGFSELQLAKRMGVQKSSIERWESGETSPRANRLNQLAGVLNVSLMWLIAGDNSPSTKDTPDFSATKSVEDKLEQADRLINELSFVIAELRANTRQVQRNIDEMSED